jgi:NAD(P)-dependent dehydrogenase (short-subunit alcohol dehydrogenase family)
MPGLLADRIAVVTGGGSGIGAAVVDRFTREGARGIVLDLPAALDAAALPDGWTGVPVDLRDDASIAQAFARVAQQAPRIDHVVAAAGVVPGWATIAELDLNQWDAVMAVNARGLVASLKHLAPLLADDGGSVVVIASLNSWRGDANLTTYAASKHAALGVVRSAALDLGRRGIRVNGVAPGPIATEALLTRMRRRAEGGGLAVSEALARAGEGTALGRIATAQEVAAATLFLASELASGVTGHLLPVDGGIS